MCGIGGVFDWSDPAGFDATRTAADLCAALAHRGPDGEGTFIDRGVLLVHRRLAIIDTTVAGRQPMTTPDGRYTIVFNGEIYNYRDLRTDLARAGVRFVTASDTEVLLALIVRDGIQALSRARGMFALAIWDNTARTLTVARDRFGIKPLYIAERRGAVAFASEIAALRRARLVDRDVSPAGILAFLAWSYIPSPLTWLRGVEHLAPGTWRTWHSDGSQQSGAFADFTQVYEGNTAQDERELCVRASEAIRDSIAAHLVADVPVGVFLSGGVDSTAIVAHARKASSGELHTYTVAGDVPSLSELEPARRVATFFETTHHELMIGAAAMERTLPSIIRRLDAPSADAINSSARTAELRANACARDGSTRNDTASPVTAPTPTSRMRSIADAIGLAWVIAGTRSTMIAVIGVTLSAGLTAASIASGATASAKTPSKASSLEWGTATAMAPP